MIALGVVRTPDCSISVASDEFAPPSARSIAGSGPFFTSVMKLGVSGRSTPDRSRHFAQPAIETPRRQVVGQFHERRQYAPITADVTSTNTTRAANITAPP